jgi:arylsulfatase A-like enzyme
VGVVAGLAESLAGVVGCSIGSPVSDPDLWVNWNAPWLAPIGLAVWLAGLGVLACLISAALPRSMRWLTPRLAVGLGAWSAVASIPGLDARAALVLAVGLGLRLGPSVPIDGIPTGRRFRQVATFVLFVWTLLALRFGALPASAEWRARQFGPPSPSAGAPNVLLVVLDTVRADHLGLYGYDRPSSPRLDARARRDGVAFTQARSTTPYTLGSHASLFTGHRALETSARTNAPLDDRLPTLAEHLRDRGYATAAFQGNIFYGSAHYGLDRGFSRYRDVPGNVTRRVSIREALRAPTLGRAAVEYVERRTRTLDPMQRRRFDAVQLRREAITWVDSTRSRDPGRPFFLFVNFFDAHAPYTLSPEAPHPFARITPDALQRRLDRLQALENRSDVAQSAETQSLRAEVCNHLRDLYDDGIAAIDRQLDALLDDLDRRGLLDHTLVILTADHGEMLGEHGLIGHGNGVFRPVLHVPLIVLGGKGLGVPAGRVVTAPVSIRDIPATVAELTRTDRSSSSSPAAFPGRSLSRFWTSRHAPADSPVLSEMEAMPWQPRRPQMLPASGPMWCLTDTSGFAYHRQDHETLGRLEHLFDLQADPGEQSDLAADPAQAGRLATFRTQLDQALAPMSSP